MSKSKRKCSQPPYAQPFLEGTPTSPASSPRSSQDKPLPEAPDEQRKSHSANLAHKLDDLIHHHQHPRTSWKTRKRFGNSFMMRRSTNPEGPYDTQRGSPSRPAPIYNGPDGRYPQAGTGASRFIPSDPFSAAMDSGSPPHAAPTMSSRSGSRSCSAPSPYSGPGSVAVLASSTRLAEPSRSSSDDTSKPGIGNRNPAKRLSRLSMVESSMSLSGILQALGPRIRYSPAFSASRAISSYRSTGDSNPPMSPCLSTNELRFLESLQPRPGTPGRRPAGSVDPFSSFFESSSTVSTLDGLRDWMTISPSPSAKTLIISAASSTALGLPRDARGERAMPLNATATATSASPASEVCGSPKSLYAGCLLMDASATSCGTTGLGISTLLQASPRLPYLATVASFGVAKELFDVIYVPQSSAPSTPPRDSLNSGVPALADVASDTDDDEGDEPLDLGRILDLFPLPPRHQSWGDRKASTTADSLILPFGVPMNS
ncbi:hypothetical protein PUNSTDRAFT_136927 [Punctularia strigosozonata HHB-11173 SS5]|uniref:uncharacterized protein n=1 Tax=Punctularia strigosozonata (strain HHB-11173) TaxID=741275 RepID=UPI0004417461|nr:uncharacterized protein PUNSTDRAFT_136927 [Punctularia strigosozonata HHB-11173 SS5]EIN06137.1 hypothetical protein PUNSTDRAFT_136927 [Punctularia strigosozonata HHB-11173 SS5]